jgi:hypothetical protein
MRNAKAEMIHQHGQPLGRRQIRLLRHAPLPTLSETKTLTRQSRSINPTTGEAREERDAA